LAKKSLGIVLVFLPNSFFRLLFMPVHRPQRVHPDSGELGLPGAQKIPIA